MFGVELPMGDIVKDVVTLVDSGGVAGVGKADESPRLKVADKPTPEDTCEKP